MATFKDYVGTLFLPALLPIIPFGATLSPDTDLTPEHIGKVPGLLRPKGWVGFHEWQKHIMRPDQADGFQRWFKDRPCATIGTQGWQIPAVDSDANHPIAAEVIRKNIMLYFGYAPTRSRSNSKKFLQMFRLKAGAAPITKKRWAFIDPMWPDIIHAIEILGKGEQYVIEGEHPSGVQHQYDVHPLEWGYDNLTEIDNDKVGAFYTAVKAELEAAGFEFIKRSAGAGAHAGTGSTSGERYPIGDERSDRCDDLELLRDLLRHVPCDADEFIDREDWVNMLVAIKVACAGDEEFFNTVAVPWCTVDGQPGNDLDYVRSVWESIKDGALGWSWLTSVAGGFGWYGAALTWFEPLPDVEGQADTPAPIRLPDEDAIAEEFERLHARKRWLYIPGNKPGNGAWRRFVDSVWVDDQETVFSDVSQLCCHFGDDIRRTIPRLTGQAARDARTLANALHTATKARSVLAIVRARSGMHAKMSEFDARPLILGVPGGYIDAEGKLRPPDPSLMLSRCARFAPDASVSCQRWKASVMLLCNGDAELYKAMRRLLGYVMTGNRNEQKFVFLHGAGNKGGQGKTGFLRIIYMMLGSYSGRIANHTFTRVKGDRRDFDISDLDGAWFAFASEINVGAEWDEGRLKEVTGGDGMHADAKFFQGRDIDRMPSLWFAGNHMPRFRDVDDGGIRRRTIVVECERQVSKEEDDLEHANHTVAEQGPGIMHELLVMRGEYLQKGLYLPKALTDNAETYFDTQDKTRNFMSDEVVFGRDFKVSRREVYARYRAWCYSAGHVPEGRTTFYDRQERHTVYADYGVTSVRTRAEPGRDANPTHMYVGMKLVDIADSTIEVNRFGRLD